MSEGGLWLHSHEQMEKWMLACQVQSFRLPQLLHGSSVSSIDFSSLNGSVLGLEFYWLFCSYSHWFYLIGHWTVHNWAVPKSKTEDLSNVLIDTQPSEQWEQLPTFRTSFETNYSGRTSRPSVSAGASTTSYDWKCLWYVQPKTPPCILNHTIHWNWRGLSSVPHISSRFGQSTTISLLPVEYFNISLFASGSFLTDCKSPAKKVRPSSVLSCHQQYVCCCELMTTIQNSQTAADIFRLSTIFFLKDKVYSLTSKGLRLARRTSHSARGCSHNPACVSTQTVWERALVANRANWNYDISPDQSW